MRVVSIGAHPDDIEIGTGGTMAMHKKRGDEIHGVLCTLGGVRGDPKEREAEAQTAARLLGIQLHILDYPVSKLNKPSLEFVSMIKRILQDIAPDRVYSHSLEDYHQVHVGVGRSVLDAANRVKQLLFFEVISSTTTDFRPNAFVDITEFIELKIKSIEAHRSQFADRQYLQPDVLMALAKTRYVWSKVGKRPDGYAEGFIIHRLIV